MGEINIEEQMSRERIGRWNGEGPVEFSRFAKALRSDLYVSPAPSLTHLQIVLDTHEAFLAEGFASAANYY